MVGSHLCVCMRLTRTVWPHALLTSKWVFSKSGIKIMSEWTVQAEMISAQLIIRVKRWKKGVYCFCSCYWHSCEVKSDTHWPHWAMLCLCRETKKHRYSALHGHRMDFFINLFSEQCEHLNLIYRNELTFHKVSNWVWVFLRIVEGYDRAMVILLEIIAALSCTPCHVWSKGTRNDCMPGIKGGSRC